MESQSLTTLFKDHFGKEPDSLQSILAHASHRKLYRISHGNESYIGVLHNHYEENRAFIAFSKHFKTFNLPVPKIITENIQAGIYIQEDLGETTLFDLLASTRSEGDSFPAKIEALYKKAVTWLPHFQIEAGKTLDYAICYPHQSYNSETMTGDIHAFEKYFLSFITTDYDKDKLNEEFKHLVNFLAQADSNYFLYRDFQARNIMVKSNEVYFIDYQSGRKGALQYDIASLLYQAQAKVPKEARERILATYLDAVSNYIDLNRDTFLEFYYAFGLIRLLQVLGTYGRVGLGEGKEYFCQGIPYAIQGLTGLLDIEGSNLQFPTLRKLSINILEDN